MCRHHSSPLLDTGFSSQVASTIGIYAPATAAAVNATGWSITGLEASTTYRFRIKATGVVESEWTQSEEVTTPAGGGVSLSDGAGPFYRGNDGTVATASGLIIGQQYTILFTLHTDGSWDGSQIDYEPYGVYGIGPGKQRGRR